jgi:hypothetical protein
MTTICGHERDVLIWALGCEYDDLSSCGCESPKCQAQLAIDDPVKLAALIAEVGMSLGLSIRLRLLVGDGEWPDFEILYFPNEYAPTVQPKLGFYDRTMGKNWDVGMERARSILLQWLRLPNGAREEAERVLRGET